MGTTHFGCPIADSSIYNGQHGELLGFCKTIIEKEAYATMGIPPFSVSNFELCQVYIV